MGDMSDTIIAKSDQMNAIDLVGITKTIKITGAKVLKGSEQPVSLHYEGDEGKPYKPCKTIRRILVYLWGDESKDYIGRTLVLRRDPDVTWGGKKVGGIRISHMSHIERNEDVPIQIAKGQISMYRVEPLKNMPAAEPLQQPAEEKTESPPHVKLAADVVKKIKTFTDPDLLTDYMATDAAEDLDTIQKASEKTYNYVVGEFDKHKATLNKIPE
jgi:hypothetical protein